MLQNVRAQWHGEFPARTAFRGAPQMSEGKPMTQKPAPDGLLPARDEVGPATQDLAFQLSHDLSDTAQNLRDAVAFAPLAAAKLAQRFGRDISTSPRRSLAVVAAVAAVVAIGVALARRRRS